MLYNNKVTDKPEEIAMSLHIAFTVNCNNDVNKLSEFVNSIDTVNDNVIPFTRDEVKSVYKKLNTKTKDRILNNCIDSLAIPLALMFTLLLSICEYPDILKKAKVTPIYKGKGSRKDPNNWRPISNLTT